MHAIGERTQVDGLKAFPLLETLRIHADIHEVPPICSEYLICKLHIDTFRPETDVFAKHILVFPHTCGTP